uniref:Uncharacterized protein n=1 Tax=Anopheles merus TaxID=30066 RepID=A0A182UYG8_ANOME
MTSTGPSTAWPRVSFRQVIPAVQPGGKLTCRTVAPQITSSIIYPASALSTLPQDVLLNLLQSGQIQLHSEGNIFSNKTMSD